MSTLSRYSSKLRTSSGLRGSPALTAALQAMDCRMCSRTCSGSNFAESVPSRPKRSSMNSAALSWVMIVGRE
ncbi:MAG: hypothetical protein GX629_11015 [Phycisphaerae bacterium]|nr:hypothetical protein [Phycisphaerae bacterium]